MKRLVSCLLSLSLVISVNAFAADKKTDKKEVKAKAEDPKADDNKSFENGKTIFTTRCVACHKIGTNIAGGVIGPDLENSIDWLTCKEGKDTKLTKTVNNIKLDCPKKDLVWIKNWITKPQDLMKDPYIQKIMPLYYNAPMIIAQPVTDKEIDDVIVFLKRNGK